MIIRMNAKCNDMFSATLINDEKNEVGSYDGYVPRFFPEKHFGDYVQLDIEVETGRILNWKVPTEDDLDIFKKVPEED